MKLVVLLSAGRHPVSDKPVLPKLEAQAIRLANGLGEPSGLHVGPDSGPADAALGQGLGSALVAVRDGGADPVDAIVDALSRDAPDVVFAGRRSQGGDETGLVPYAVAARLGVPLVSDVVAVRQAGDGLLQVDQSLPKGALRRLTVKTPVVLTVHPNAPAPLPFAFGKARRGLVVRLPSPARPDGDAGPAFEERPYRKRPKMMRAAPAGGSAADRLKAVTGEASSDGAKVLDHPSPQEAAKEVLAFLRRVGVLAPVGARATAPDA